MESEINNAQSAQIGDLAGSAAQGVSTYQQASGAVQSQDSSLTDREKFLLNEAFKQSQRLVSKSENRQTSQFQGIIDKFKSEFGVNLTEQQAQEMAANQYAKSMPNVQTAGQQSGQQANPQNDPSYQGFLYYHGIKDNPVFREAYTIQNTLGVKLEQSDPEYQNLYNRENKYQPKEFVDAWKQACIAKIMRLQAAQNPGKNQDKTNLGQMPLIGGKGKKANDYDPKRPAKSYFDEYMRNREK